MTTVVHVPRRLTPRAWGGTERVLAETLPLLEESGLRQRVLTTRALDASPNWALGDVAVTRFGYFYPEWPLSEARRELYDRKGGNLVSFALARRLSEVRDLALVHCHTGNRLAAQCLAVARRRQVPCVLSLHGGHFAVPSEERLRTAARDDRAPPGGLPWGKVLSGWWRTRSLLERMDAVVCVGIEEYELCRERLRGPEVVLLPGGVNVEAFEKGSADRGRELLQVPKGSPLVACVARLDSQKDQRTLVQAFRRLPDRRTHLALVGPETEPGYAASLCQIAGSDAERLRVVDALPSCDVPDVLAAADIAVLPSRHEPFGLSCLEAWAAGVCLVAADVGGPRWLLRGGHGGRLFPPGDVEALKGVLTELLDDPTERRRLAAEGSRRARDEFTWRRRADSLLALYRRLGVYPRVRRAG